MNLDSGIAIIRRARNAGELGGFPVMVYDQEVFRSYFGMKTVGVIRNYLAQSANNQADFLIEIQRCTAVKTGDQAELKSSESEDFSGIYRIIQVQQVEDDDGLPATDLTIQRWGGADA